MRNFVKVLLLGTMLVSFGGGVLAADSGYSWRMSPKDDGNFYNVAITENGKKNGAKFVYFDDQGWEVDSNGQRTGRVVRQDSGIYFLGDAKTGGNAEALYTSTSTRRQFVTNMGNIPVSQGVADGTVVRDYDSMWSSPSYEKLPQGGWADRGSKIGLIYDSPKDSSASYFKSTFGGYDHTDVAPRADATPTSRTSQPATLPSGDRFPAGNPNPIAPTPDVRQMGPADSTPAPGKIVGTGEIKDGVAYIRDPNTGALLGHIADGKLVPETPAASPAASGGAADPVPTDFDKAFADPKTRPIGALNPENKNQVWNGKEWTEYTSVAQPQNDAAIQPPSAGAATGILPAAPLIDTDAAVNRDNIGLLGGKEVFGGNWFSNNSPTLGADGNLTLTDSQAATLKSMYGLELVNGDGIPTLRSDGSALGNTRGQAMVDLMNAQSNLANARRNWNTAALAQRDAQAKVDNLQKQYDSLAKKGPSDEARAAREQLDAAKGDLDKANKNLEAATAARDAAHDANVEKANEDYNAAMNRLIAAKDKLEGLGLSSSQMEDLNGFLSKGDMGGYNDYVDKMNLDADKAAAVKQAGADINAAQTDVENAGGIVKQAETPETNEPESQGRNIKEAHAFNVVELVLKLLTSHAHSDHTTLRDDINIKAAEIGPEVAPVDSSALDTNKGVGVGSKTIGGAVEYFKALLSAAVVDLGLLSEEVKFEEPETPITIISNAVLSQVAGSGSGVGGGAPAPSGGKTTENDDENEEDHKDETDNALTEAERKVIEGRRAQLLRQYVNAGIQISEGMNAISHDFPDRAAAFGAVLEKKMDASALPSDAMAGLTPEMQESAKEMMANQSNVQSEPQAFGLAQDVGRYVLFETLRGVALSSTQMGVQATRLLFEQEVLNEKTE